LDFGSVPLTTVSDMSRKDAQKYFI
jgi:hypothetical protein